MVVSKLNATRVAEIAKDIPQNVNFAIRSNIATNFLDANGITARAPNDGSQLAIPDVAERAKSISAHIQCRN